MATSASWDLEKYKSEFESDEHWQLRKRFMEFHKDKYPEEKLVCLARVFCNVEFLGCRYPEKTMKLVAELSKGVADDYREKQKGKLKRTFVQASDAAGAKIKGSSAAPPNKIPKISENNPTSSGFKYTCFVHEDVVKLPPEGEFPGFIIYENCKTNCPLNILTQSAQKNKTWTSITFEFPAEKNPASNKERYCEVKLNKKVLSSAVGQTLKEAKVNAAIAGLNKLRQSCYTIQEKLSFFTDAEPVSKEKVVKGKEQTTPLPQDNIGSRMMMKMGWTGAGLGKKEQGIQAPIEASETMRRAGFGHLSTSQFHAKFRNVFKDYISSGSTNDLVFAPDFSSDERKILHKSSDETEDQSKNLVEDRKQVFEDGGEDLFGFDSDSEVMFPQSSDEEVEEEESIPQRCEVCSKLEALTGEESDDQLLDMMWETGSDTTGLVSISEDIHTSNDQKNSHEAMATLPSLSPTVDPMLCSRVSEIVNNLNTVLHQRAAVGQQKSQPIPLSQLNLPTQAHFSDPVIILPALNQSTLTNKKKRIPRVNFLLPDGSTKRIGYTKVNADKELKALRDKAPTSNVTVTKSDLLTIRAFRDLFPELVSKLEAEERLQCAPDSQHECESPAGKEIPSKIADSNIETVAEGGLQNTPETQDDCERHTDEGNPSDSDTETVNEGTNKFEATFKKRRTPKARRARFYLADGSTVRIKINLLYNNSYHMRNKRRENELRRDTLQPKDYPPPDYSDSTSDESDIEWNPKSKLLISEPSDCEIDKTHILRKRWEKFIIKFGSSKRNPFARKWRHFVDQSPPDEIKPVCQKWKDFMETLIPADPNKIPDSILQPSHQLIPPLQSSEDYIPPLKSSKIDTDLITLYSSNCTKLKISKLVMPNLAMKTNLPPSSVKTDLSHNKTGFETSGIECKISNPLPINQTEKQSSDFGHLSKLNILNEQKELGSGKPNLTSIEVESLNNTDTSELPMSITNLTSTEKNVVKEISEDNSKDSEEDINSLCWKKNHNTPGRKRMRDKRVRLFLADGSRIRLSISTLLLNKDFVRSKKRIDSIIKGLIKPDEIPPPYYSDSSTEDETDWVSQSKVHFTEPDDCEIDKIHILRKNWEHYILKVGSSKRNPLAKKWREFLDQSPAEEKKTICQKWKDFMTSFYPGLGKNIPDSVLQAGHQPSPLPSSESEVPRDELQRHLPQPVPSFSSQSDLEKHINSCDLTVVHDLADSSASGSSGITKRAKTNKVKNPNLVTGYFFDGCKIRFDHILLQKKV